MRATGVACRHLGLQTLMDVSSRNGYLERLFLVMA